MIRSLILCLLFVSGCSNTGPASYEPLKADTDAGYEVWAIIIDGEDGFVHYFVLSDESREHLNNSGTWTTPTDRDNLSVDYEESEGTLTITTTMVTSYFTQNTVMEISDGKMEGAIKGKNSKRAISGTAKKL